MTVEEKKAKYTILAENDEYTLIDRHTSYCTYVVCWQFDKDDYTWAQGHYYNNIFQAVMDMDALADGTYWERDPEEITW